MTGALHRVGVRHHSPACARLVESTLRAIRPRTVLIEGPSDLNGRLGELRLDHELPVALFSFLRVDSGMARASWYPLCSYSPEWVALQVGHELGADVVFMDLPSWHDAFSDVVNRGADRPDRYGEAIEVLCARTGASGLDALWDHLFESVEDTAVLAEALDHYFDEIRELSPVSERDAAREAHMAAHVAAARARGGDVVVVCGGYHSPVLDVAAGPTTDWPATPTAPEGGQAETYLVPYSYRRLDAFTGYQSGMPSPAYYEALHQFGAATAADRFFELAVRRLRGRASICPQRIWLRCGPRPTPSPRCGPTGRRCGSTCWTASPRRCSRTRPTSGSHGTSAARCTRGPTRSWSSWWRRSRGPHRPARPRHAAPAAAGRCPGRDGGLRHRPQRCAPNPQPRSDPVRSAPGSVALHRLRVLGIPGFDRHGSGLAVEETWALVDDGGADVALIEASIHGPTLETAAAGRLTAQLEAAASAPVAPPTGVAVVSGTTGADAVAAVLLDALHCGLDQLAAGRSPWPAPPSTRVATWPRSVGHSTRWP